MTKKTTPAYRASKEETIPINKLHPFSNHPFHIRHDLEFSELVDSISESGIITPIIVRPKVGVGYKSYMTYNKSHVDDFLSHNRINHSEEDFVLVKGDFEPIVSEVLWETCNQIRSKRAAVVKGK
ncbi:ParB N-terminal domain-containing protein, partial [Gemmiger formicilis]|uniref:ParB N-terminal domain-containing protein n=1 Tax=Gemmiger formicilis TaxID=745368 RepID=UPI003AAA8D78